MPTRRTDAIVRDARLADCPAIAAIYTEHIRSRRACMETREKTVADIEAMLLGLTDREALLVLEVGNDTCGWGHLKQYSDRPGYRVACEFSNFVRGELIHQGLGAEILRALIERGTRLAYHHVVVRIVSDNTNSIDFCLKFGFEMVGIQREVGILAGRWRNVALMQLILDTDLPKSDRPAPSE